MAAPLTVLTKKGIPFKWTVQHQTVFESLRALFCSAPILAYPQFDRPFILQTDASNVGLGAVLAQLDDNGHGRVFQLSSMKRCKELFKGVLPDPLFSSGH